MFGSSVPSFFKAGSLVDPYAYRRLADAQADGNSLIFTSSLGVDML